SCYILCLLRPLAPPRPTLFPYTTLFRSRVGRICVPGRGNRVLRGRLGRERKRVRRACDGRDGPGSDGEAHGRAGQRPTLDGDDRDRKSTRLNSSHVSISYAVFCLKKKKR